MTPTTKSASFQQLVWDYEDNYRSLMECDPTSSVEAMNEFIEIQKEGKRIEKAAKKLGFTFEEIEDAADV